MVKIRQDDNFHKHRYLYHMIKWSHAREAIDRMSLRFSPVKSWSDPFERWWCEQIYGAADGLGGTRAYGFCCTIGSRDEPRWRMAAAGHSEPIVRFRIGPRPLVAAAWAECFGPGRLYLGDVRYRRTKDLAAMAKEFRENHPKPVSRKAADLLMQKRMAFAFEREVRLLWLDKQTEKDAIWISLPAGTITQLMISPYVDQQATRAIRQFCDAKGIEVLRSLLLEPPR